MDIYEQKRPNEQRLGASAKRELAAAAKYRRDIGMSDEVASNPERVEVWRAMRSAWWSTVAAGVACSALALGLACGVYEGTEVGPRLPSAGLALAFGGALALGFTQLVRTEYESLRDKWREMVKRENR